MRKFLGTAFLSIALAACGGGGGSGGGGTPGSNQPPQSASGLMPVAPAPGAVLYADASVLRPFRAGATWNYRGAITNNVDSTVTRYVTATTHDAGTTSTSAVESSSNSSNLGADTANIVFANGMVSSTGSIDFANTGIPQTVTDIELKSPVRQGEQYNIFDAHFATSGIDADNDGKPDALDVAIYAQVVGSQTIQLQNLPSMQGVEVDTTIAERVTFSSTGQLSNVVKGVLKIWYVPGIGIVREQITQPTFSGGGTQVTDEQIVNWDGVTSGLGVMDPVRVTVPSTNAVYPGRTLQANLTAGPFAFPDHVLVFTDTPDLTFGSTMASTIDLRGHVTSSQVLTGLSPLGIGLATANGVVFIKSLAGGTDYGTTQLDATGSPMTNVTPVTMSLDGGRTSPIITRVTGAVDGTTLWLLFDRSYYDAVNGASNELILRPFALDGTALGPEIVVDPYPTIAESVSASSGKLLLSWDRQTGGGAPYSQMYAFAQAGSSTVTAVGTLASGSPIYSYVWPLRVGANSALFWDEIPGSNATVGAPGGILLDANMQPVRAGTTLPAEQIPGLVPFQSFPHAAGARVAFFGVPLSAKLWFEDLTTNMIGTFSWMDTTSASLASTPVYTVRALSMDNPVASVVYADRMIVFGGSSNLTTEVVWLNKGN